MRRRRGGGAELLLVLAIAGFTLSAQAHTRSVSYSSWTLSPAGAEVRLRVTLLELSRLGLAPGGVPDVPAAIEALVPRLALERGGVPCSVARVHASEGAPEGWLWLEWRVDCSASGGQLLSSRLFLDVAPGHLHFARVAAAGGEVLERVLHEAEPTWELAGVDGAFQASDGGGTSLLGYTRLGVGHILSGWDHLAFVLALLLLAGGVGEVAGLVTGFTVAHSVTLGLAVLGVLRPDGAAVEAMIGFSIALVAAENAWLVSSRGWRLPAVAAAGLLAMALLSLAGTGAVSAMALVGAALFTLCHFGLLGVVARPARLRVAVAFAFGLIHGFGFAGVLAEMSLPSERLAPALFGFNLGVEIGQLGVVIAVWPLLRLLEQRRRRAHEWVAELGSAAICGLGVFWFVSRSYGG